MSCASPIGVLDSGLGGLSVFSEIVRLLPEESVIYYGDGKNCPYGEKPKEEIIKISDEIVCFLIGHGCKLIVLACNTATADAIDYLREKYPDTPFVGMEPAVKPAVMSTRTGVVGILATAPTLEGRHFKDNYLKYAGEAAIIPVVGEGFVNIVENGEIESHEAESAVRKIIDPLIEKNVDRIVLGCTHYPFLKDVINKIIGEREIEIINPAPAVVRRIENLLVEKRISAPSGNLPYYEFYSSSGKQYLNKIKTTADKLLKGLKK